MKVGVNYPWLHYDWDFGPPPVAGGHPWGPRAEWRSTIATRLAEFHRLGIFAVRWFLLCSGLTYGQGADAPTAGGPSGWTMANVPRLSRDFIDDFTHLLRAFSAANVQLMPVFVDFHMFQDEGQASIPPGYVKGRRWELVADPTKRAAFLQNALVPLLNACRSFRHIIYAFDVINEPEWAVRNRGVQGNDPSQHLDRSAMLAFLRESITLIHRANLKSSVGFARYENVTAWNSIALDVQVHQYHYYSEPARVPTHTFDPKWPLIVGEFATAVHDGWPQLRSVEAAGTNIVYNRLGALSRAGYPAAFAWSAEDRPSTPPAGRRQPVDWSATTKAQIARFNGLSYP